MGLTQIKSSDGIAQMTFGCLEYGALEGRGNLGQVAASRGADVGAEYRGVSASWNMRTRVAPHAAQRRRSEKMVTGFALTIGLQGVAHSPTFPLRE